MTRANWHLEAAGMLPFDLGRLTVDVNWIGKLRKVDLAVQYRGSSLFARGAVDVTSGDDTHTVALVKDRTVYTVVLDLMVDHRVVLGACGCSPASQVKACRHVYAALLAAETAGHLQRIASMPMCKVEAVYSEWEELNPGVDYGEPIRPPKRIKPVRKAKPPKPPEWKLRLAALRGYVSPVAALPPEAARSIVYVMETGGTAAQNDIVLRALTRRTKKNGDWSKLSFNEACIRDVDRLDVGDRRILTLLAGMQLGYTYSGYPHSVSTRFQPNADVRATLAPMLCATGRCFLKPSENSDDLVPLEWDDGPPWVFHVTVGRDEVAGMYTMTASLRRDGEVRALGDPTLVVPGLAFFGNRLARFDDGGAFHWVHAMRAGGLAVPFDAGREFMAEMVQCSALPPIEWPDDLRIDRRVLAGPPHVKIRPTEPRWRGARPKLKCEVVFDYGGVQVSETDGTMTLLDPAVDRYFTRDQTAEAAAMTKLHALGVRRANTWESHRWELTAARLPQLVRALGAEGWRVEADGKLYRRAGSFNLSVTSGIDWFDLEGQADFEGETAGAPQILKAIARGESMVRLDDGSYGLLPEEWLKRYRMVAAFGESTDGRLRFRRHQAGLLDALLASEPETTFDAGFQRVREELQTFAGVRADDPAPGFTGQLRQYQREGLGWLRFLRRFGLGGCLADDMGLGKTIQALALLDSGERQGPALVVVPRSLIFNWKQEAAKFSPGLRVLDHTGIGRKQHWERIGEHDIVLTTYGTLRRDAPLLKDIHFDTVILDEAQAIKNPTTESAKAVRLLKADHRLALTGTPVENRLGDLWSIFEFLNPGMLGSAPVFRSVTAAATKDGGAEEPDTSLEVVGKALRPFILRRAKEQVARELPARTEQTIYCELDPDERRVYNELRDHYRQSLLGRIDSMGIEKSRMHILEALLRLRQAACHPGLIDKSRVGEGSSKVDSLVEQVAEVAAGGHKALVFSQFTSLLAIVRQKLDVEKIGYEYLDGRTRDRESVVRRFQQDGGAKLFLISLKAGGLGLNLTAAEYVFLLDPWWNPAVEAQAIDRSHRIGQTRQVFAYRLIARDTVEEKVLELQKTKRALADAIVTADNSVIAGLNRENLELLLS